MRFIWFLEPRFLTNNRVISVIENTKVKGPYPKCSARGYPEPTISWKIGENIMTSANGSVTSTLWNYDTDNNGFKGAYRVLKDGTLYIDGFFTKAPTSQNYFQCIARNVVKERRQNYNFVFEKGKYRLEDLVKFVHSQLNAPLNNIPSFFIHSELAIILQRNSMHRLGHIYSNFRTCSEEAVERVLYRA